jgi:hypothetical protein
MHCKITAAIQIFIAYFFTFDQHRSLRVEKNLSSTLSEGEGDPSKPSSPLGRKRRRGALI